MVKGLVVSDVTFDYPGPLRALDGLSLEVAPGELCAVVGPNGAGKSTLLGVCTGLSAQTSGVVTWEGTDVRSLSSKERARRIAFVPQSLRAVPEVTIDTFVRGGRYGHLDRWRRASPRDGEVVARCLEACDVGELGGRLLADVSGGQRQRVLVARALAQEASLVVVDEPTSSLDPGHQLSVFALLEGLAREGRTVVVVTHDLNLAAQFATTIRLLHEGRLAAHGAPADVLRPDVLEPVYGTAFRTGTGPGPAGEERPFVLPWRSA